MTRDALQRMARILVPMVAVMALGLAMVPAAGAGPSATPAGTAAASSTEPGDCWPSDNADPRLVDLRITPGKVSVITGAAVVRVRARARDTGGPGAASGVRSVTVHFGDPDPRSSKARPRGMRPVGDGWFEQTFLVPRKAKPAAWRLERVVVRDRDGNIEAYDRAQVRRVLGRVPGVAITTTPDATAPRLASFSVTPRSVDTTESVQHATFTARVSDAHSDVAQVFVDGGNDGWWLWGPELKPVAGKPRLFQARVEMPRWIGSRVWRTQSVTVVNSSGTSATVTRRQLQAKGITALDVAMVGRREPAKPQARSFDVGARTVDVRNGDARVSFRMHVTDVGSGADTVWVEGLGSPYWMTDLKLVSGTAHDGIWAGEAVVPRCGTRSRRTEIMPMLWDADDWYDGEPRDYYPVEMAELGWQAHVNVINDDHVRPEAGVPPQVLSGKPIVVNFDERVWGVSPGTVSVARVTAAGALVAAPGGWWCLTFRGQRTGCATGNYTRAVFRPERPLQAGARYAVTVQREGQLGITDHAGNPVPRILRYVRLDR